MNNIPQHSSCKTVSKSKMSILHTTGSTQFGIRSTFDGEQVHLLQQVDDFAPASTNEAMADKTCNITGKKLQLPNKAKPPISKMGLMNDVNGGIDASQTDTHIKSSCTAHINWSVIWPWMERRQTNQRCCKDCGTTQHRSPQASA